MDTNRKRSKVNRRRINRQTRSTKNLHIQDVMPHRHLCWMNYIDDSATRTSSTTYMLFRYRANYPYDPDPLLLTGSIAGYKELAAIYRSVRVTAVEYEWRVTNLQSTPIELGVVPSNMDLASVVSSISTATDVLEQPFSSGVRTLSQAGGMDRTVIKGTINLARVYGSSNYRTDISTASLLSGVPAVLIYLNFIVLSPANLTSGIYSGLRLRFQTEWYDRQIISVT